MHVSVYAACERMCMWWAPIQDLRVSRASEPAGVRTQRCWGSQPPPRLTRLGSHRYLLTYLLAYLRAYLLTCLLSYLLIYLRTCVLTCLLAYLLTCLLAYLLTLLTLLTYLLTYLPASGVTDITLLRSTSNG